MTTPSDHQPREAAFFTSIRKWGLMRGDNGFLGGVVDGVAQRIGMATVPARIITVILGLVLNGLMLLAYAAAWALLPDRRGNIIIQNFGRGMPNVGALIGIGIMALLGLGGLDNGLLTVNVGDLPWDSSSPFRAFIVIASILVPLAILGGLVALVIVLVKRSSRPADGQPPVYAAPPVRDGQAATPPAPGATPPVSDAPEAPEDTPAEGMPQADPAATTQAAYATAAAATSAAYAQANRATQQAYDMAAQWPAAPPAPPRLPRIPGPGRGFYLATLAWAFLSVAGIAIAERQDALAVHPFLAWFVTFVTGLGVILMLISLTGRKLGFLGFVGIVAAFPTLAIAANADDILRDFAGSPSLVDFTVDTAELGADEVDLTSLLDNEYSSMIVNGTCVEGDETPAYPQSTARLSYTEVPEDTKASITAEVTYVTIPRGANLSVVGIGDAQAHVVWPDLNVTCDFYGAGGTHLDLSNGSGPSIDLVVRDDQFANTIVITEAQS